jgi:hypothetical protein
MSRLSNMRDDAVSTRRMRGHQLREIQGYHEAEMKPIREVRARKDMRPVGCDCRTRALVSFAIVHLSK